MRLKNMKRNTAKLPYKSVFVCIFESQALFPEVLGFFAVVYTVLQRFVILSGAKNLTSHNVNLTVCRERPMTRSAKFHQTSTGASRSAPTDLCVPLVCVNFAGAQCTPLRRDCHSGHLPLWDCVLPFVLCVRLTAKSAVSVHPLTHVRARRGFSENPPQ